MAKDVRLQKMLADCGVASRRKAEEMIANGQVRVNGVIEKRVLYAPQAQRIHHNHAG